MVQSWASLISAITRIRLRRAGRHNVVATDGPHLFESSFWGIRYLCFQGFGGRRSEVSPKTRTRKEFSKSLA